MVFIKSKVDQGIHVKFSGSTFFVVLYVDNILLSSNDNWDAFTHKIYSIKVLGETSFVLGIEIIKDKYGILYRSNP